MLCVRIKRLAIASALVASATLVQPQRLSAQEETVRLTGRDVAIYNIVGLVTLRPGAESDVLVSIHRRGPDAEELEVVTGSVDTRHPTFGEVSSLRILYPGRQVTYRDLSSRTQVRVRNDGTIRLGGHTQTEGRQVEIRQTGGGTEASADLEVLVPRGKRVLVVLGGGVIEATNVEGDLTLETGSANIQTSNTAGVLRLGSRSGSILVADADGTVDVDTGSGKVRVQSTQAPNVHVDTGSGAVTIEDIEARELGVDTGSGNVSVRNSSVGQLSVSTGSGDVALAVTLDPASLGVSTGSGDVAIGLPDGFDGSVVVETGSGRVDADMQMQVLKRGRVHRHRWRHRFEAQIGTGDSTHITIETGSGDILFERS